MDELEKCTLVDNQFLSQRFFYLAYMLKSHFVVIFDYWVDILKRYLSDCADSEACIEEIKKLKVRLNNIYAGLLKSSVCRKIISPSLSDDSLQNCVNRESCLKKFIKCGCE
ncbi:MAG: hypothetical protein ACLR23_10575 [Clostridia bacterium]